MKVWVGHHPNLGIVIFDPTLQDGIPSSRVRLWDVAGQRFRVFQKSTLKKRLTSLRAFLLRSQLTPLLTKYDVVRQIATAYWAARPQLPEEFIFGPAVPEETFRFAPDPDEKLIWEEHADDQEAWARSEEEGWYYKD
jgi:hypothetical protein